MNRTLILIGLLIIAIGLLWPWLSRFPFGQLPGDIVIRRENVSFYFPITTMILLSLLVSAILWLFHR
ncbi:DUF2905 domain-containing protein [Halomonas sp. M4R5S39]|uniref:DUF2905 domain-containing protein n=1 Tax=Halomonas kalidii TaxID=3043293 RepID=A0ABT6VLN2_9GAMM|nr:DUF2905 domain-containing protein [Halomonas kalidii]MDI5934884.1 DUF2905 domain-containing protein [Halomonas kalidii]MDI5984412.1 DUF2905 domain-containing protein [Halomonas kalidii]